MASKIISICITIFFVLSLISIIGLNADSTLPADQSISILFVGGAGNNNFTTIQEAIDNASSGDIIFVHNGTYHENLIVNKTIDLIGENRSNTIIDSEEIGNGITISADRVLINNITIQNNYIGIYVSSDNNTLTNTTLTTSYAYGIKVSSSHNNTIFNNQIKNNKYYGISSSNSNNNTLINNQISYNRYYGILLTQSHSTIFSNNLVANNGGYGMQLTGSNKNTIANNSIKNNIGYAIQLTSSNENHVDNNNISNSTYYGIRIRSSSNNNTITSNFISNIENYGIRIHSNNNTILYHNTLFSNGQHAYDEGNNTWYHSRFKEGNYWDDYNETDLDGDGVGDKPYNIPGGGNQDRYPLGFFRPIANFTYSPKNPDDWDVVEFSDKSFDPDGVIVDWYWQFGDGRTSRMKNPMNNYSDNGLFTVKLTVLDDQGYSDSFSDEIMVSNIAPSANFSYSPVNATIYDTINFTDNSIDLDGTIVKWYWTFGDGETSTDQNSTHQYENSGIYTVNLTVTDNDGAKSSKVIDTVEVTGSNNPPTANFSVEPDELYTNEIIYFNSTSTDDGSITNYTWKMGDGSILYGENITHEYNDARNYIVSLRVIDNNETEDILSHEIEVKSLISIEITSPTSRSVVSGIVTIEGTAYAEESIDKVELKIDDNSWYSVNGRTNWNYTWNTTMVNDGDHVILVRCIDKEGNSIEKSITVTVKNEVDNKKPSVTISHPVQDGVFSGIIIINGSANDTDGTIERVDIKFDRGTWESVNSTNGIWEFSLNTSRFSNGYHHIYARSFDGMEYSSIESVRITIRNNESNDNNGDDFRSDQDDEKDENQNNGSDQKLDEEDSTKSSTEEKDTAIFLAVMSSLIIGFIGAAIYIIRL